MASTIANRSKNQHEKGFKIIGLRDLYAKDFESLPSNIDRALAITNNFKKALSIQRCHNPDEIGIFFAVMEIEAWLLAFTEAVSKWAKTSEDVVSKQISENLKNPDIINLELIKRPSLLLADIGKMGQRQKSKTVGAITLIVNNITQKHIEKVYTSKQVPSFNKFWSQLCIFAA